MKDSQVKTQQKLGFTNAFRQFGALFGWSLLVASAANIGLSPLLVGIAIATIGLVIFLRRQFPFIVTPSFVFLPALVIFMRGYETLAIGSPAWNFRLGGLLVSFWISGLLYILMATLVRQIGIKKMRRIFSPTFSGILIVFLTLALLPRVFIFGYYEPSLLEPTQSYKFIIIGLASFMGYLFATALAKKPGTQASYAILLGLVSGLLVATIIDAIELLWLSQTIEATILFRMFTAIDVPLTIFHHPEINFGFWQYLHFDIESLLLIVPLTLVTIGEHMHAMTIYALKDPELVTSPHADKTLLTEGLSVMVGGMITGYPFVISEDTVKMTMHSKKAHPLVLIGVAIIIMVIGIFMPVTYYLQLIPLPIIGGVLLAVLGFEAVKGFSRVARLVHDDLHPQATALGLLVLGLGMLLAIMEFVSDFLGNTTFRIMIGTTPIPSFLIIVIIAFVFNLLVPKLVE